MKSNYKIEWLTKSSSMYDFFTKKSNNFIRGGRIYEIQIINSLINKYEVSINSDFIKRSNLFHYILKNHKLSITGDICFVDPYVAGLGKFEEKRINVSIVHHIDERIFLKNLGRRIFYNNLIRNLKKMDLVVVVSKFWEQFLLKKGIKKIKIVYNSFDVKKYNFQFNEIEKFKKKYKLNNGKPNIYVGPYSIGKGVNEIIKFIDKKKYNIITTSKKSDISEIYNFYFNDDEYRLFLSSCDLVLCMSNMPEGWNRIAHESILANTPVIGSGSGGMKELLENSNQYILKNINDLNKSIERILKNKKNIAKSGFKYASQFDNYYFKNMWGNILFQLINEKQTSK